MAKSDINKMTGKFQYRRREFGEMLARDAESERLKKEKLKNPKNYDTVIRQNIHGDIKGMLAEGRNKIDILVELSNKYSDTNLSRFFEQWIEHHLKKQDYLKIEEQDYNETR